MALTSLLLHTPHHRQLLNDCYPPTKSLNSPPINSTPDTNGNDNTSRSNTPLADTGLKPDSNSLSKLVFYAETKPFKLEKLGKFLVERIRRNSCVDWNAVGADQFNGGNGNNYQGHHHHWLSFGAVAHQEQSSSSQSPPGSPSRLPTFSSQQQTSPTPSVLPLPSFPNATTTPSSSPPSSSTSSQTIQDPRRRLDLYITLLITIELVVQIPEGLKYWEREALEIVEGIVGVGGISTRGDGNGAGNGFGASGGGDGGGGWETDWEILEKAGVLFSHLTLLSSPTLSSSLISTTTTSPPVSPTPPFFPLSSSTTTTSTNSTTSETGSNTGATGGNAPGSGGAAGGSKGNKSNDPNATPTPATPSKLRSLSPARFNNRNHRNYNESNDINSIPGGGSNLGSNLGGGGSGFISGSGGHQGLLSGPFGGSSIITVGQLYSRCLKRWGEILVMLSPNSSSSGLNSTSTTTSNSNSKQDPSLLSTSSNNRIHSRSISLTRNPNPPQPSRTNTDKTLRPATATSPGGLSSDQQARAKEIETLRLQLSLPPLHALLSAVLSEGFHHNNNNNTNSGTNNNPSGGSISGPEETLVGIVMSGILGRLEREAGFGSSLGRKRETDGVNENVKVGEENGRRSGVSGAWERNDRKKEIKRLERNASLLPILPSASIPFSSSQALSRRPLKDRHPPDLVRIPSTSSESTTKEMPEKATLAKEPESIEGAAMEETMKKRKKEKTEGSGEGKAKDEHEEPWLEDGFQGLGSSESERLVLRQTLLVLQTLLHFSNAVEMEQVIEATCSFLDGISPFAQNPVTMTAVVPASPPRSSIVGGLRFVSLAGPLGRKPSKLVYRKSSLPPTLPSSAASTKTSSSATSSSSNSAASASPATSTTSTMSMSRWISDPHFASWLSKRLGIWTGIVYRSGVVADLVEKGVEISRALTAMNVATTTGGGSHPLSGGGLGREGPFSNLEPSGKRGRSVSAVTGGSRITKSSGGGGGDGVSVSVRRPSITSASAALSGSGGSHDDGNNNLGVTTATESEKQAQLDGERKLVSLLGMVDSFLREGEASAPGLPVGEVTKGLIEIGVEVFSRRGGGTGGNYQSQSTTRQIDEEGDYSKEGEKATSPSSEVEKALSLELERCLGALGCHVYYPEQVSDIMEMVVAPLVKMVVNGNNNLGVILPHRTTPPATQNVNGSTWNNTNVNGVVPTSSSINQGDRHLMLTLLHSMLELMKESSLPNSQVERTEPAGPTRSRSLPSVEANGTVRPKPRKTLPLAHDHHGHDESDTIRSSPMGGSTGTSGGGRPSAMKISTAGPRVRIKPIIFQESLVLLACPDPIVRGEALKILSFFVTEELRLGANSLHRSLTPTTSPQSPGATPTLARVEGTDRFKSSSSPALASGAGEIDGDSIPKISKPQVENDGEALRFLHALSAATFMLLTAGSPPCAYNKKLLSASNSFVRNQRSGSSPRSATPNGQTTGTSINGRLPNVKKDSLGPNGTLRALNSRKGTNGLAAPDDPIASSRTQGGAATPVSVASDDDQSRPESRQGRSTSSILAGSSEASPAPSSTTMDPVVFSEDDLEGVRRILNKLVAGGGSGIKAKLAASACVMTIPMLIALAGRSSSSSNGNSEPFARLVDELLEECARFWQIDGLDKHLKSRPIDSSSVLEAISRSNSLQTLLEIDQPTLKKTLSREWSPEAALKQSILSIPTVDIRMSRLPSPRGPVIDITPSKDSLLHTTSFTDLKASLGQLALGNATTHQSVTTFSTRSTANRTSRTDRSRSRNRRRDGDGVNGIESALTVDGSGSGAGEGRKSKEKRSKRPSPVDKAALLANIKVGENRSAFSSRTSVVQPPYAEST